MSNISECQEALFYLAETQGYLTFDDIMDATDASSLSVAEVDRVSEIIQLRGIIVYETAPQSKANDDELEDYSRSDYESVYAEIINLSENLKTLVEEIRMLPPPQYGELSTLTAQVANGNDFARGRLISLYMRNALKIALSMTKQYELDIEDAVSAGLIGLINAVDQYDPNGFSVFPSYASMWIQQNIQRNCNPIWMDFYFPAHFQANLLRVYQTYMEFTGENTIFENVCDEILEKIASETNIDVIQVKKYIETVRSQQGHLSLDSLIEKCENGDIKYPLVLICDADHILDEASMSLRNEVIASALSTLTERERQVLYLRYGFIDGKPKTLEDVGTKFNVTRERIRQIESRAIKKLQQPSRSKRLKEFY